MALNLGVDLDGCTVAFQEGWTEKYTEWFEGDPIDPSTFDSWDTWKGTTHFATELEWMDWINSVPQFWEDLPPVQGALGALYKFQVELGHTIRFITSRSPSKRNATVEWVRRHYPSGPTLPDVNFLPRDNKGALDVQVYVDDDPVTIESLRHKPVVIIFDAPWNKHVKTASNVHRCRGWGEVFKLVRRLEHDDEQPFEPVQ